MSTQGIGRRVAYTSLMLLATRALSSQSPRGADCRDPTWRGIERACSDRRSIGYRPAPMRTEALMVHGNIYAIKVNSDIVGRAYVVIPCIRYGFVFAAD